MRRIHRLAFSSILIPLPLGNVAALRIDPPLPANVTRLEPVPFIWHRDSSDPDEFGFVKWQLEGHDKGPSDVYFVKDSENESGSFTLTFTTPSPFLVFAVKRHSTKSPFFTAPGTLVALSSAVTTSSPSPSPSPSQSPNPNPPETSTETRTETTSTTSNATPITTLSSTSTRANSSRGTTTIPQPTATNSTPPIAQQNQRSKKGAIIGGVIGGLAGLIVVIASIFYLLRRRRKRAHQNNDLTPYFEAGSATSTDARDQKVQIIGLQRERLERQLEAFERTPPYPNDSATEVGTVSQTVNDAVQALRCQIELLTDRLTRLEGERTERLPPDYSSA
ncbi:hypothetical protein E1B28_013118 [Marasmius oreades]|nr:uncharacterized protein E1B28_013118 [Marasmius oreades]KAG7087138.1 hypothetical protein E1B28_013118 [Marasmius oreades]